MNIIQRHVENQIKNTLNLSIRKKDDGNGYVFFNSVTGKVLDSKTLKNNMDYQLLLRTCAEEGFKFWVLISTDAIQVSSQATAEKMIPIIYQTWMRSAIQRSK